MISKLPINVITPAAIAMMLVACDQVPTSTSVSQASQADGSPETAPTNSPIYHPKHKRFQGFGRYLGGYCQTAYSNETEEDAVAFFEESVGTRVTGYRPFADGLIVTFRNGFETVVWAKEIDCKDPTYDPLEKPQQSDVLMSDAPVTSASSYADEPAEDLPLY